MPELEQFEQGLARLHRILDGQCCFRARELFLTD